MAEGLAMRSNSFPLMYPEASPATVAYHLRKVFATLGISSGARLSR